MNRFSLADAQEYASQNPSVWPDAHRRVIAYVAWHKIRYRADNPVANSYDELHKVCQNLLKPFLGCLPDLHITGSWLGGWWSHPEYGAEDKQLLRAMLGKPSISDLDFWTPDTDRNTAMDVLKSISREVDIPVSWVEWWGPAMDLTTGKWRAANPMNLYKSEWAHLNEDVF